MLVAYSVGKPWVVRRFDPHPLYSIDSRRGFLGVCYRPSALQHHKMQVWRRPGFILDYFQCRGSIQDHAGGRRGYNVPGIPYWWREAQAAQAQKLNPQFWILDLRLTIRDPGKAQNPKSLGQIHTHYATQRFYEWIILFQWTTDTDTEFILHLRLGSRVAE